ncbi:MAG: hypothetical protein AAF772_16175 [Acidobacteriota bacterium]
MPFRPILEQLLRVNRDAVAVIFLDDSGEMVHLECVDFTAYDMKVLGAYAGIYLRQFNELDDMAATGAPQLIHVEKEHLHLFITPLPDGYYLVLVQRRPASTALARRTLEIARRDVARETFGDS